KITEFPLPNGGSPHHLAAGPDGRIWFCEYSGDRVGAMTTAGALQEYPIRANAGCSGIAAASRWLIFTETKLGRYGHIDAPNGGSGDTSAFLSSPLAIATGRDGRYWITQAGGSSVYANPWASKPLPNDYATVTAASHPYGVAPGPDGRMWVTEFSVSKIGAC